MMVTNHLDIIPVHHPGDTGSTRARFSGRTFISHRFMNGWSAAEAMFGREGEGRPSAVYRSVVFVVATGNFAPDIIRHNPDIIILHIRAPA